MNFRFPIFLDLTGKKCLVTGAGYEVADKVKALVAAAAKVTYIHPEAEMPIRLLAEAGLIRWEVRAFEPGDLVECFLVISDLQDNSEIFRLAEEQQILCNAVDDPPHCRFSFGSVHRQGDLTIAISSNGIAPAVAVRIRQRLEREIGPEYGELLELLKALRPEIASRVSDFSARRRLWYRIVDSGVLITLRRGRRAAASRAIRRMIENAVNSTSRSETSGDTGLP